MATANATQQTASIHPIWALLALPAMILLLGSDAGNNLSIVEAFSSGELNLLSWQGLALGAAMASAPLGFASGKKKWLIMPTGVICIIGGVLTVMSTNTDFAAQSQDAGKYTKDYSALNAEREALLESLKPTDGSLPCKKQRWCDSQAKESRLAQINTMVAFMDVEVDPLATPAGKFFAQLLAYLRAFGVPFVVASLAHCLGLMFHKLFHAGRSTPPDGYKRLTDYDWQEDAGNAPTIPDNEHANLKTVSERVQRNTVTSAETKGVQRDTGIEGKAGNRYGELKRAVLAKRVRPSIRQVRNHCGCRQEVAQRYIGALADEGIIERAGQGWKLAVPREEVKIKVVG